MKFEILNKTFVVALIVLFTWSCSDNENEVTGNQEIGVINFYFENGRYFDVLVEADTLSAAALDDPELRFIIAKTYLEIGHPDRAQEILNNLKTEGHNPERIDLFIVEALFKQNKIKDARTLLLSEEVQAKYSENSQAILLHAEIELAGNNIDASTTLLKNISESDTEYAHGQVLLARVDLLQNRESKAVERIQKILDGGGDHLQAWLLFANIKFSNGEYLDAENYYLQALKQDNSKILTQQSLQIAQNIVLAKTALGNSIAGEQFYQTFLDSYPKSPIYFFELARLAYSKGDLEVAEENLRKVLKTTENNPRVIALLAKILIRQDKLDDARELLEQYIVNSMGGVELIALKSISDFMAGDNHSAIDLLSNSISENEEYRSSLTPLLAYVYLKNNDANKYKELMNGLEINSAISVKGINTVRTIFLETDNYEEAENFLNQLVLIYPKSNEMKVLYLSTLNDIGKNEDISEKISQWLKEQSENTILRLISINQAIENASYRSAIRQFNSIKASDLSQKEKILLTNNIKNLVFKTRGLEDQKKVFDLLVKWQKALPNNLQLNLILADIYISEGVYNAAVPLYETILKKHPNDYVILNNLAWSYFSLNDNRALDTAERAYASNPNDAPVCDTLGWILVESGQVDRGLKLIEQAIEIDPNNPDIQEHYKLAKAK